MKHEGIEEKDSFGEAKKRTENIETKKDRLEAKYGKEKHRWKMYYEEREVDRVRGKRGVKCSGERKTERKPDGEEDEEMRRTEKSEGE